MASSAPVPGAAEESKDVEYTVELNHLTFTYSGSSQPAIEDITFKLPRGSRCLLVGDNGAGKTTILRNLAGRHIHEPGAVKVLGRESFHDTSLNFHRAYMGCDWGRRTVAFAGYGCPITADVGVTEMMKSTQEAYPERRKMLMELLGINPKWRMHQLSDGQRRRVQIFLQLLRPSDVLLLDEITTDLDVITRQDFLQFLKEETIKNGTTIVYATHIFGGLDDWGTHIAFLGQRRLKSFDTFDSCADLVANKAAGVGSPLLRTVEGWLRIEKDAMKAAGEWVAEPAARKEDHAIATDAERAEEDADLTAGAAKPSTGPAPKVPSGFSSGRFNNYFA